MTINCFVLKVRFCWKLLFLLGKTGWYLADRFYLPKFADEFLGVVYSAPTPLNLLNAVEAL